MLYPKNSSEKLDSGLFKNPTSEYRGTPFWSWNCKLDRDLLERQIEILHQMGFGGFHMHSRTGMATEYLSDEFMGLVKFCVEQARDKNMLAWLYDEDRWPSGSAGGIITKDEKYRERYLLFTPNKQENGRLLACYDITLDADGYMTDYRKISENESGGNKWYAYLIICSNDPWFNNQAYINTLDKNAVDEFIRVTYETYKSAVGDDFGGIIPAIFTDEPQFSRKSTLGFAFEKRDVRLPWSDDLPETYLKAYGEDLIAGLPELIWDLSGERISRVRYHYHDHIAQRFADAFANNCGAWCRENNLMLTGHMMEEPTLESQTAALGEAMRSYSGFDLPGIDMLCDRREYNTAKQAQSAVHQYGCVGMLSELYGVTNWDFDFRGHKLQGDWQAALGVTVRVPHLSWVSMAGEAKRDYPASISYQSPWYKEYPLIEDHFARVNTAMTRGKPVVKVGVIHPVESYWLRWGPSEQTDALRRQMDENHANLTDWMIFGQIDFDFISESLLPEQCAQGGAPLAVGKMKYDTVIIPGCTTIRATTAHRLEQFLKQGGKLIVVGDAPRLVDAADAGNTLDFLDGAVHIPFEKCAVLDSLEDNREISILNSNGARADHLITQMRQDGDYRWLFIVNGRKPGTEDLIQPRDTTIRIKGRWIPELYDTMTGDICRLDAGFDGNSTVIRRTLYTHDSLLLRLIPGEATKSVNSAAPAQCVGESFLSRVPVELSEPNALLLDIAEYTFDGGEYQPRDEILRIDNKFREKLGLPGRFCSMAQPWVVPPEKPEHTISLRFTIKSEIDVDGAMLALEDAEDAKIVLNGTAVPVEIDGWYVDESIKTVKLPKINAGENLLELTCPFGRSTNLEWCYLLGDFGVRVSGSEKTITPPVRSLAFGSIIHQGLPFYGGNVTYKLTVEGGSEPVSIQTPYYKGALIGVTVDGAPAGHIVFDPYTLTLPPLSEGNHEIGLVLFGNRSNAFGPVHNCDHSWLWFGPDSWRTGGDRWSYEYNLNDLGIMKSPVIIKG